MFDMTLNTPLKFSLVDTFTEFHFISFSFLRLISWQIIWNSLKLTLQQFHGCKDGVILRALDLVYAEAIENRV